MKIITFSMVTSLLVGATQVLADPTIDPIVHHDTMMDIIHDGNKENGELYGQFRSFYLDRTFSGTSDHNRNALAVGGYIGYMTPIYNGLSAMAAVYGTYGFDIRTEDAKIVGSASYDPSLYGVGFDNYAFIGQAYINYMKDNTHIRAGRMRIDTPFLGADDARMLPNLFEALTVSNRDLEDTIFRISHVFRETVGTYGSLFNGNTEDLTSGYGKGLAEASSGNFLNMGTLALGNVDFNGDGNMNNETAGVSMLSVVYTGFEDVKLQAWDYIGWDIMNTLYLEADYTLALDTRSKIKFSGQYINQTEIGKALAAKIDTNYYAVKMTGYYENFSAYLAYSATGNTNGVMGGNVISPWGGMPAYTVGMVTRHQFFANTDAWKISGTYDFKAYGLKASAYYLENNVGLGNIMVANNAWRASEAGWDIQYKVSSIDGLNIRARANYPRNFKEGLNWDEYRLILNYNF